MQLLAGGRRLRPIAAIGLLGVAAALLMLGLGWALVRAIVATVAPAVSLGASPDLTPAGGGDTRSAGEGPGLVGAPLVALAMVALIALIAIVATLVYVRLTSDGGGDEAPRG